MPTRLPKAIQAILTNYRGATVGAVPEAAIPAVLARLAAAAREAGHMPDQRPDTAEAYRLLEAALRQFDHASNAEPHDVTIVPRFLGAALASDGVERLAICRGVVDASVALAGAR